MVALGGGGLVAVAGLEPPGGGGFESLGVFYKLDVGLKQAGFLGDFLLGPRGDSRAAQLQHRFAPGPGQGFPSPDAPADLELPLELLA